MRTIFAQRFGPLPREDAVVHSRHFASRKVRVGDNTPGEVTGHSGGNEVDSQVHKCEAPGAPGESDRNQRVTAGELAVAVVELSWSARKVSPGLEAMAARMTSIQMGRAARAPVSFSPRDCELS